VLVTRNPFDWARAMHAAPWETRFAAATAAEARDADALEVFLATPWLRGLDTMSGDASHAGVLAMRAAKHAAWGQASRPWRHVAAVPYECLLAGGGAGARAWLSAIEARFNLTRAAAAAAGWQLPASRVGGVDAFARDALTDSGDAEGAFLQRFGCAFCASSCISFALNPLF
jgi:hypothetical protein